MNATLRHMTLRFWLTAFAGGLACTLVLPQWQRLFGMAWIAVPVAVLLCACFFLLGWLMNRLGVVLLRRQVAEAAVWERAGMSMEAEAAFEQAKSLYDSFWLSPLRRRAIAGWITKRLARFYLVQTASEQDGQAMVMSYLAMQPHDHAVAKGWLEAALHREHHSREAHDLAGRIADALADDFDIQVLLLQFFLSEGRMDFEAMQTYRRAWAGAIPGSLTRALARLLLNEGYIDDWALQVYLKAYAQGAEACLEGIAAGVHLLRPTEDNRHYLTLAGDILKTLDPARQKTLSHQFQSFKADAAARPEAQKGAFFAGAGKRAALFWRSGAAWARVWPGRLGRLPGQVSGYWQRSPKIRNALVFALLFGMGSTLAITAWHLFRPRPPAPEPVVAPAEPAATPISDPFTIQVAAYLTPGDALKSVNRLKKEGIDAYFTKANSLNRTWYQVKVSHFATKEEAGRFGEMLKSKGLIDDFYVANYNGL